MLFGSAFSSISSSVDVRKESDAGSGTKVDFSGKRGNSDVDPVVVDGGKFVSWISR